GRCSGKRESTGIGRAPTRTTAGIGTHPPRPRRPPRPRPVAGRTACRSPTRRRARRACVARSAPATGIATGARPRRIRRPRRSSAERPQFGLVALVAVVVVALALAVALARAWLGAGGE